MRLKVQPSKCSICNLCSIACAYKRVGQINLAHAAIQINPQMPDSLSVKINVCVQCVQGYCMDACPVNALQRVEDGRVILNPELCTTCNGEYKCASACKVEGMSIPGDGSPVIKCDVCDGDPQCAKVCPWQLISVV